jgi:hypothetical protein
MSRERVFKTLKKLRGLLDEEQGISREDNYEPEIMGGGRRRGGALNTYPASFGYGRRRGGAFVGGARSLWTEYIHDVAMENPGFRSNIIAKKVSPIYQSYKNGLGPLEIPDLGPPPMPKRRTVSRPNIRALERAAVLGELPFYGEGRRRMGMGRRRR